MSDFTGVAKSGNAPDLGSGDHRFKSDHPYHFRDTSVKVTANPSTASPANHTPWFMVSDEDPNNSQSSRDAVTENFSETGYSEDMRVSGNSNAGGSLKLSGRQHLSGTWTDPRYMQMINNRLEVDEPEWDGKMF